MELITKEWLEQRKACKEDIDFAERNGLVGFPVSRLGEITGDFNGFVSWVRDASKVKYEYDASGNMIKQVYPSGSTYLWEYDASGNKVKKVDPNGNTYLWEYDASGNMIKEVYPNGRTYICEYILSEGQLIEVRKDGNSILTIPEF